MQNTGKNSFELPNAFEKSFVVFYFFFLVCYGRKLFGRGGLPHAPRKSKLYLGNSTTFAVYYKYRKHWRCWFSTFYSQECLAVACMSYALSQHGGKKAAILGLFAHKYVSTITFVSFKYIYMKKVLSLHVAYIHVMSLCICVSNRNWHTPVIIENITCFSSNN